MKPYAEQRSSLITMCLLKPSRAEDERRYPNLEQADPQPLSWCQKNSHDVNLLLLTVADHSRQA
jgi:hypothetical protein